VECDRRLEIAPNLKHYHRQAEQQAGGHQHHNASMVSISTSKSVSQHFNREATRPMKKLHPAAVCLPCCVACSRQR
jgi:hypothetical protein